MKALPLPTLALLVLTPFVIAIGQVMFKMTSQKLAGAAPVAVQSAFLSPLFLAALTLYGTATLIWVYVLKAVPLSYAYSFMALTFVFVPLLAHFMLGETINTRYLIGIGLILIGLVTLWS
jgi:drug/metabolite transporter (DMT)-like permease